MITGKHVSDFAHGQDSREALRPGGIGSAGLGAASLEAIESLLAGGCGMGQQLMLIAAIRRDSRIDLSDAEIKDLICEAIEEGWSPETTLTRLVALDDGSDGIRGADCCNR